MILLALLALAPVETVWLKAPAASAAIANIRPHVHSVEAQATEVVVRSAGLALDYLGPLQNVPKPPQRINAYEFRFPRAPRPAPVRAHLPAGVIGAFVNGVPIYNPFEASSYRGQNLWHYDTIRPPSADGLIEKLILAGDRHSPIIGFALDGYPIYGPWALAGGSLRRMRSSYRLRQIDRREVWPGGLKLAPGQEGPPVHAEYPLGTFVEDYEFAPGSGDLDECNGRFAVTPEYPQGTYAYFLATDAAGAKAFPYLLAHEYHGEFGHRKPLSPGAQTLRFAAPPRIGAGGPVRFHWEVIAQGRRQRYLEHVHERPMHVLIVSDDLAEFDHVHPEVTSDNRWELTHRFPTAGRYSLYVDYAPPGGVPRVERFSVLVHGARTPSPPSGTGGVRVELTNTNLTSGRDVELQFRVSGNTAQLEPYLGAWAHVMIAEEGLRSFVHAHPLESGVKTTEVHTHGAEALGPPPETVRVLASFPRPGAYKIWVQMQVAGEPRTWPIEVRVAPASLLSKQTSAIPPGAIVVKIDGQGFTPLRIQAPAGRPFQLAFVRSGEPNCGGRVAIAALGVEREVPLGGVTIVALPPQAAGEFFLTCGMGMYRGAIVVR